MSGAASKKPVAGAAAQTRQRALNKAMGDAQRSFRSGDPARAEAILRQVLAADPLHLDAMHLMAAVMIARQQLEPAAQLLRKVVKLNPAHVAARTDLGEVLRRLKQFKDAEGHLLDVLKLKPRMEGAWLNLGNVYLSDNRMRDAEKAYKQALKFGPKMAEAAGNLSFVQLSLGLPVEAAASARKAISLQPGNARHHSKLALALDRMADEQGALAAHKKAEELAPESIQIRMDRARSLSQFGHMDEAIAAYRSIAANHPERVAALTQITRLKKFTDINDPDILALREIAGRDGLNNDEARAVNFALGKALEDCKQYEEAFGRFLAGNQAARKSIRYAQGPGRELVDDIIRAYDRADAGQGGKGPAERAPIFILGLPRSGTSLTEQIIGQHPAVYGAGELGAITECERLLLSKTRSGTHVEIMRDLGDEDFEEAAQAYLASTRSLAPAGMRIADKAPSNFSYIGMIKRMFPEASIIHCRRNITDNALSIFKTNFVAGHMPFSFDLDDIADRLAQHQRLMAHWEKVMPDAFFTNDYETMVADQEAQSRKLLDWCGLDWHDEVLRFHESSRPVHTASIAQVRQPIHSGSVGLLARYGEAARPLLDALNRAGVS